MIDISKHFFILLYIISFFIGIILLTLNQIYIAKTNDGFYKKLQSYNWAFWVHIVINFIYFYGLYFWISWEVKDYILFIVNTCFVVFLFFTIQMLQDFSDYHIPYGKAFLILAGASYITTFFLTYEDTKRNVKEMTFDLSTIFFFLSEVLLVSSVIYCCIVLLIHWLRNKALGQRILIPIFCVGISAYAMFNTYVDLCFCFFREKTSVWGINIYNLTIIFYIILNLISIPLLYKRELYLNTIVGKSDPTVIRSESTGVSAVSSSIITDFAEKYHLTMRETEVLGLICRGMSNPDISKHLFISINTVKHHANSIFKKADVKNRYELISILK